MDEQILTINRYRFGKHETVTIKGRRYEADHYNSYIKRNEFDGSRARVIELSLWSARKHNYIGKLILISYKRDGNYVVIEKIVKFK